MTLPCLAAYGRPPTFKQVPADSPRSGGCQRACQQQNRGSRRARRCGSRVRAITAHKLARVARQGEGGALSNAVKVPDAPVALSTASVYPERTANAFEAAATLGYDGVEVMVTGDPVSQDVAVLERLVDYHHVPVLAIHAPCLLITQRVWGREPWGKLVRAKEVAEKLGARVVVVHPPFRWQRDYARDFTSGLERMREESDVIFAVENMYPLRAGGAELAPYAPHWNPVLMDSPHVALDLSHAAVSGSDAYAM